MRGSSWISILSPSVDASPHLATERTPFPDLDQGLPQRIAYIGSDRVCRLASRAFLHWCGRSVDQVVGALIDDFVCTDEHALALPLIERALSGSMVRHQHEVLEANGGKELREILAIDDFGTGYSSLSYLQHLPIDVLKIDQSFVRGIGSSTHVRGGELVRSIIHLGHSLGLELVAEGVETGEQAAWLFGAGCEVGQGFWFARPAPLSTFLTTFDRPPV